jgi:DNA-binding HxlR family transcriptional regulator
MIAIIQNGNDVIMERVSFAKAGCPIARSLELVGEWWSILIMRDALNGQTRFDEFQRNLGIAPNMLTRRLKVLVSAGLLERRKYCEKPARYEYVVTGRGLDFRPVLWTPVIWGSKHFAPEGPSIVLVDRQTGKWAKPVLVDARNGKALTESNYIPVTGPAASKSLRSRYPFRSVRSGLPLERNEEPWEVQYRGPAYE